MYSANALAKSMANHNKLPIEVAYASPQRQAILALTVPVGCTAEQAIRTSGILEQFPEIDLSKHPIGIFSRKVPLSQVLSAGDRVEIYRPLQIDPKAARRRRAEVATR